MSGLHISITEEQRASRAKPQVPDVVEEAERVAGEQERELRMAGGRMIDLRAVYEAEVCRRQSWDEAFTANALRWARETYDIQPGDVVQFPKPHHSPNLAYLLRSTLLRGQLYFLQCNRETGRAHMGHAGSHWVEVGTKVPMSIVMRNSDRDKEHDYVFARRHRLDPGTTVTHGPNFFRTAAEARP